MKLKQSPHTYAIITIFFWSFSYVFSRLGLQYFSPSSLAVWRYAVASATMLVIAIDMKLKPPAIKDLPWFVLCGITGFSVYIVILNMGTALTSASTASLMLATAPVVVALCASVLYKEKLPMIKYAAIGISFAGVVVLTVLKGGFTANFGLLYLMCAALMFSVYNLVQRKLTKTYSSMQVTAYGIFSGTLILMLFAPEAVREIKHAPAEQYLYVILLGVFSSALAYCSWAKAFSLARHTSDVSNYMFVTPFLTTLFAFLLAGEPIDVATIAGGSIIIGGLLLFNFGEKLIKRT